MKNFDLTKYLAEGKLHEELDPQDVVDIADTVAEEFTKESADKGDFMVYSVGELDSADMTFELDTDTTAQTPERILNMSNLGVGEGWGGNFRINSKEEGYEVRNAEKGGLVAIIDNMGNFKMLSADESRAEMGRTKGEETDYMQRRRETDDYMEEGKMLDEGMLDGIKDKIVAKVEKIKNKFSDQEIEKMKSAAEKALGKPAGEFTMADFTVDNIKKVGKAITALNEEDQIAEGLGEKIQGIGSGLGMTAMFVGGNMAMGSAAGGVEGFIAGAIAFVLSLIVGGIIKSRNNEAQEAPKSNKIPAEKLFALIARDLKFSPLAQDGAMLSKEEAIEIMRHVIAIEQSDISPEAALGEYIANGEFEEVKEIKSNKMKKSELKEMIKAAMMAETSVEETLVDALSIREEEEDVEDEIEVDDVDVDVDVDMDMDSEPEGIDVKQDAKAELGGNVGDVQDNLEAALMAARELGDEKLEDQIGNTLTFFTRQHVVKEDMLEDEAEMGLEEALNKPVDKLGPDVEKRLQSMGFETKVFPNPSWGNIPDEAIKAIEANPKLAGIAFVKNNSGTEAMRVMVNAERKKDLQKVRDYFQVPEENFGPAKELSWVTKQIQNINPGDWVASQAKVLQGNGNPVAAIDWFRTITKGASQTTDARGDVKMDFGQAAESLNESVTFPIWNKIK